MFLLGEEQVVLHKEELCHNSKCNWEAFSQCFVSQCRLMCITYVKVLFVSAVGVFNLRFIYVTLFHS
jgi:hypothetical protein